MKKILLGTISLIAFCQLGSAQLLYDQTANALTNGILCRTNVPPSNFDTEGADDFTVPSGEVWVIDSVYAIGTYSFYTPPPLTPTVVRIHYDDNGVPGSVLTLDTVGDGDLNNDGTLEIQLANPLVVPAGKYWLSVTVISTTPWYWRRITELVTESPLHWKNPGGGYNTCTEWTPLHSCSGVGVTDSSAAFSISGCIDTSVITLDVSDTTICEGESVTYSVSSSANGATYFWSTGETTNSISADSNGWYTVTIADTAGSVSCPVLLQTGAFLSVVDMPEVMLDDQDICATDNSPATFAADLSGCNGCTFEWNDGSSEVFYSTYDAGTVTLTIMDTVADCEASGSATVTVYPAELNIAEGVTHTLCEGDTLTLTTVQSITSPIGLLGNLGIYTTESTSASADFSDGGTAVVSGVDGDGCNVMDTAYITKVDKPIPTMTTQNSPGAAGTVVVKAESGFVSYAWSTGGTGGSVTVEENGAYYVTVTDDNGCEGSNYAIVNTVGAEELKAAGFNLYPNPAISEMHIQWPAHWVDGSSIAVIDLTGRVLIKENATETTQTINLSQLSAGQYLVQLDTPEGIKATTVVVAE
ncbi:MAG: hypothetical protein Salg2KO_08040 [Salibacteraceae bacterium]